MNVFSRSVYVRFGRSQKYARVSIAAIRILKMPCERDGVATIIG